MDSAEESWFRPALTGSLFVTGNNTRLIQQSQQILHDFNAHLSSGASASGGKNCADTFISSSDLPIAPSKTVLELRISSVTPVHSDEPLDIKKAASRITRSSATKIFDADFARPASATDKRRRLKRPKWAPVFVDDLTSGKHTPAHVVLQAASPVLYCVEPKADEAATQSAATVTNYNGNLRRRGRPRKSNKSRIADVVCSDAVTNGEQQSVLLSEKISLDLVHLPTNIVASQNVRSTRSRTKSGNKKLSSESILESVPLMAVKDRPPAIRDRNTGQNAINCVSADEKPVVMFHRSRHRRGAPISPESVLPVEKPHSMDEQGATVEFSSHTAMPISDPDPSELTTVILDESTRPSLFVGEEIQQLPVDVLADPDDAAEPSNDQNVATPKRRGRKAQSKVSTRGSKKRPGKPSVPKVVDSPVEPEIVANNVDKKCPRCPDEFCTKQHLLAVHNNVHPDEYAVICSSRAERKRRWADSVAAGYKLRCQNADCDRKYTTPAGLDYHVTSEGLCRQMGVVSRDFSLFDKVNDDDSAAKLNVAENLHPTTTVVADTDIGRVRRSAAVRAEQHMHKVLQDERKSDWTHERELKKEEEEDVDNNVGTSSRQKKRRRRPSNESPSGSVLSLSDGDDDFCTGSLSSSSSSASSDKVADFDRDVSDTENSDADVAGDAGDSGARRRGRTTSLAPTRSKSHSDSTLNAYIYAELARLLHQPRAGETYKPSEKLLRRWAQTVDITGVCSCRVCHCESKTVGDARSHFFSCEKLNSGVVVHAAETLSAVVNQTASSSSIANSLRAFYLNDEYELCPRGESLLQCRLCSYGEMDKKLMTKHCSRNGAHADLLNHTKVMALLREITTDTTLRSSRRAERAGRIARTVVPYLCTPAQRDQILHGKGAPFPLKLPKQGAYESSIKTLLRARQEVSKLMSRLTISAETRINTAPRRGTRPAGVLAETNSHVLLPEWMQRLLVQQPNLSAWSVLGSEAGASLAVGSSTKSMQPGFCAGADDDTLSNLSNSLLSQCFRVRSSVNAKSDDPVTPLSRQQPATTLSLFDVSNNIVNSRNVQLAFVGGPVTSFCWLPGLVYSSCKSVAYQILALTVEQQTLTMSGGEGENFPAELKNLIQFWRVRRQAAAHDDANDMPISERCNKNDDAQNNSALEFAGGFACNYGAVHGLTFLPAKISDKSDEFNISTLAAVTDKGVCAVYLLDLSFAVPLDGKINAAEQKSQKWPYLGNIAPLLVLGMPPRLGDAKLLLPLPLPTHKALTSQSAAAYADQQVQPCVADAVDPDEILLSLFEPHKYSCVAWLPVAGRDEIMIGGDNGLIAFFRLDPTVSTSTDLYRSTQCRTTATNTGLCMRLYPVATITIGRGLITQLSYYSPPKEDACDSGINNNLQIFISSRESKLTLYMDHSAVLVHAAQAAACGGGDAGLIASNPNAVPVYWRAGAESCHLVGAVPNGCALIDNAAGGVFSAQADFQTNPSVRASYFPPPMVVRKQMERLIASEIARAENAADNKKIGINHAAAGSSEIINSDDARFDDEKKQLISYKVHEALERMRKNLVTVTAAAHRQSITALAIGDDANAYPCLASSDQTGSVYLNDMLLSAVPAQQARAASRHATDAKNNLDSTSDIHSDGKVGFAAFAVSESRRQNAWRNQLNTYRPLDGAGFTRRALLVTAVDTDDRAELNASSQVLPSEITGDSSETRKADIIDFCVYPEWSADAMMQAETLARDKQDLIDNAELMLGREDEVALRSVNLLSWCPPFLPVKQISVAANAVEIGENSSHNSVSETEPARERSRAMKAQNLIAFNEAGFMILFDEKSL